MKTALVAGTTGLIGSQVLDLLLSSDRYEKVIAISRKATPRNNPKFENVVVDFANLRQHGSSLKADDVFCCLGTTIRQAGSQEAFRIVDFEYPLSLAAVTVALGAHQFLIVSAMGSDKNSSIFYNRVKGDVEEAVSRTGFESLHIFKPSMLLGPRIEKRPGETAGKIVMKTLGFLIPKKYKAIDSAKVAKAMVGVAIKDNPGIHFHDSAEMQDY